MVQLIHFYKGKKNMDIDPSTITVAAVIDDLKKSMRPDLTPMIDVLEEHFVELVAHPFNVGRPQFDVLGEAFGTASIMPMYDDGIEEQLTRPLTEKFGITGIANLRFNPDKDEQKMLLCYFICGAREALRLSEVRHILQSQYDVTDKEELEDLSNKINHELRWTYNGDVKGYFEDFSAIAPDAEDIKERIYALTEKNHREKFNGTSRLPEPRMIM
jgi:hypothetical protein